MKCPFCNEEMIIGIITQDRYAIKWVAADKDKGWLNFTPLVKGIKLTSMSSDMNFKVFHCDKCRKFIIDQDDLRI
ncbi:MAG: PF20097 family protein [Erysipelotrichaceae bacterium]